VKTPRAESAKRTGKVARDVRELRRRLGDVERQIHELEARLAEIGERLGDPTFYADGERVRAVSAERKSAEEQVTWLMREWEELSTALAAHE
jgi:septal ring factor EnvC (AmiA/AmiB activator)